MSDHQQSILFVEDDKGVSRLAERHLSARGYQVMVARTGQEALDAIQTKSPDLMVLDFGLPDISGQDLLRQLKDKKIHIPFVVTTGQGCETLAVEFMKQGALDYIIKDQTFWDLMPEAVDRAMAQVMTRKQLAGAESALHKSEEQLRAIFNNAAAGIGLADTEGQYLTVNQALCRMLGFTANELVQTSFFQSMHPDYVDILKTTIKEMVEQKRSEERLEIRYPHSDGTVFWGDLSITSILNDQGEVSAIMSVLVDITERKQAEQALKQLNEELEQIVAERTRRLETSNQQLADSLRQVNEDEEAGRRIQFNLLPPPKRSIGHTAFSWGLWPSMYLSGDFLDYFEIQPGITGFYMADVSGHGLSSAFVTVLLKSFMSRAQDRYHSASDTTILNPAVLLEQFNQELFTEETGKHVTLFFGLLELASQTLIYANAGQFPYPLFSSKGESHFIEQHGLPLGLFENATYENQEMKLPDAFTLTLLSDGILEILPQPSLSGKLNYLADQQVLIASDVSSIIRGYTDADALPDDIACLTLAHRKDHP